MTELEALTTWNRLPEELRQGLLRAVHPRNHIIGQCHGGMVWSQIPRTVQEALLKLDWTFELGGKIK